MAISSNTSLTAVIYLLSQIVSAISVSTVVETQTENTSSTSFLYNQTQVCSCSLTLTLHLVYYKFVCFCFFQIVLNIVDLSAKLYVSSVAVYTKKNEIIFCWRASGESKTLLGVTQFENRGYLFVCVDVCMSFSTLTLMFFYVSSVFNPVPNFTEQNPLAY